MGNTIGVQETALPADLASPGVLFCKAAAVLDQWLCALLTRQALMMRCVLQTLPQNQSFHWLALLCSSWGHVKEYRPGTFVFLFCNLSQNHTSGVSTSFVVIVLELCAVA